MVSSSERWRASAPLDGEDRILHLRNNGVVVADHTGEQLVPGLHLSDQILAQLLLDGQDLVAAVAQLTNGPRLPHAHCSCLAGTTDGAAPRRVARRT